MIDSSSYFWFLTVGLGIMLVLVLRTPAKIYEFPYFMAATFAGFILPQAISLIRFPGGVTQQGMSDVLLMTCLCGGMCVLGYQGREPNFSRKLFVQPISLTRLFHGGLLFLAASFFFTYLISGMTDEAKGGSTWTGIVTVYAFFSNLVYPAFAICLIVALRTKSSLAWMAVAAASFIPLHTAIFYGRREDAVHFLMTLAVTLYFERGWKPPRILIFATLAAAMFLIPATADYRSIAATGQWNDLKQLNLWQNFHDYLNQESELELRNAAMVIEAAQKTGEYEWGEGYWDEIVFRFVPAQFVGKGMKEHFMFVSHFSSFASVEVLGYNFPGGTTPTGIGDVFNQLSWWGCLFFALLARFFKSLWLKSQTNLFARVLYIQLIPTAMLTITHGTVVSIPDIIYYILFLSILFYYARVPAEEGGSYRQPRKVPVLKKGRA
jgi:hypothetical protein